MISEPGVSSSMASRGGEGKHDAVDKPIMQALKTFVENLEKQMDALVDDLQKILVAFANLMARPTLQLNLRRNDTPIRQGARTQQRKQYHQLD